jgi:hypothetical protein
MSKIKKGIAVFIFFLILVGIYWFWNLPMYKELGVNGFFIQFEDGTTEPEVKAILENYDMMLNYNIDCNQDYGNYVYYLKVYEDDLWDVKDELRTEGNWTYEGTYYSNANYFKKRDYYIIPLREEAPTDKKFLSILEENNIQVKTFFSCFVSYGDNHITIEEGKKIKKELDVDEKALIVIPAIPA